MPDLEETTHSEANILRTLKVEMSAVEKFCKANGIYKSNFFTMAYSFLLAQYNNEQESLFNTIYNGRTDKRFAHSVGMVVKTLPIFMKFTEETTVVDFLRARQELMSGCREHDIYSYSDS